MPDVFVPADTSYSSPYFNKLYQKAVLNTFTLDYYDKNRTALNNQYKTFEEFRKGFQFSPDDIKSFIAKGESDGVKYNDEQFNKSREEILKVLKGLVATNIWKSSEYFQIVNENDKVIEAARKVISDKKSYNSILGYK